MALVVVIIVAVVASKSADKPEIEDGSWLVIDLYGGITEYSPPSNFMGEIMGGEGETLTRILCNLNKVITICCL